MTTKTISLDRAALALAHLTASEESRPILNRVWVKGERVEAADGFVAGTLKRKDADDGALHISRHDALATLRKTTKSKRGVEVHLTDEDVIISTEAKPVERVAAKPFATDTTAPSVAQLVSRRAPQAAVILDLNLLKSVVTSLDAAVGTAKRDDAVPVELRLWGHENGIEYRAETPEGDELTVIQMPMVPPANEPWMFDPVDGADRTDLLGYHIREAILAGRAGESAAAVESARMNREAKAGPDESGWTLERVGMPEQIETEDRKSNAHEALEMLGYSEEQIEAAMAALERVPVVSAAD